MALLNIFMAQAILDMSVSSALSYESARRAGPTKDARSQRMFS